MISYKKKVIIVIIIMKNLFVKCSNLKSMILSGLFIEYLIYDFSITIHMTLLLSVLRAIIDYFFLCFFFFRIWGEYKNEMKIWKNKQREN